MRLGEKTTEKNRASNAVSHFNLAQPQMRPRVHEPIAFAHPQLAPLDSSILDRK
jgi:hypothetical protein